MPIWASLSSWARIKAHGVVVVLLLAVLISVVEGFLPGSWPCVASRGAPSYDRGLFSGSSPHRSLSFRPQRASAAPAPASSTVTLEDVGVGRLVLIERPHDAHPFLVLVIGKEGKRNLVVCDAQERQYMVFPPNVRWVVPGSGYRVNDIKEFEAWAGGEEGSAKEEIALVEEAWQQIVVQREVEGAKEGLKRGLGELSLLMFQDETPRAQYRAFRAIEMHDEGGIFFTRVVAPASPPPVQRKGGSGRAPPPSPPIVYEYVVKKPSEVSESKQAYALAEKRRADNRRTLERLAEAVQAGQHLEEGLEGTLPDDFGGVVVHLRSLAISCRAADHPRLPPDHEAMALDFLEALGRPRHRTAALDLLIDLGVWDEHENLDLYRHQLPLDFDEEVMNEMHSLLSSLPGDPDQSIRVDQRHLSFVAIDDASTKEVDDAVCVEERADGSVVLWVAIADPSRLVPVDSRLFQEALARQSSLYLPTGTVPMFPMPLASGPMSLVAHDDRFAVSIGLHICPQQGNITQVEVLPSLVRVRARLTFIDLDALLGRLVLGSQQDPPLPSDLSAHMPPPPSATSPPSVCEPLERMLPTLWSLCWARRRYRVSRGCMEALGTSALSPDADLTVDRVGGRGRSTRYHIQLQPPRGFSTAAELIMEVMVAVNEGVAAFARAKKVPMLYRTQAPPQVRGTQTVQDAVAAVPPGPCRNFAARRFFSSSFFQTRALPHAGLGVPAYVQFTSPIRRFGDLVSHYNLKAHLRGEAPPFDTDALSHFASAQVTSAASVRNRVGKDATKYWLLQHLRACGPDVLHRGLVLGSARGGHGLMMVRLVDIPIEIAVKAPELAARLGSEVMVRVTAVGPRSESCEAVVVAQVPAAA